MNGELTIEIDKLLPTTTTVDVSLAKGPINKDNLFLYHKTTNRAVYEYHKETALHYFDVLLWNEEQEVTEFTSGNKIGRASCRERVEIYEEGWGSTKKMRTVGG